MTIKFLLAVGLIAAILNNSYCEVVQMSNKHVISTASLATALLLSTCNTLYAQVLMEPGATPEDVAMAINQPYEYAWKLFIYLNSQAKQGSAGEVDPTKQSIKEYDDNQPVVWETWASGTGGLALLPGEENTSEVYRSKGVKPVEWVALPRKETQPKKLERTFTNIESQLKAVVIPKDQSSMKPLGGLSPLFIPSQDLAKDDEIRLNRATFEHIRNNYLYSVEGLQASVKKAIETDNRSLITFPLMSKEVKARWIRIKESDKQRYHWRTVATKNPDGTIDTQLWGLSGFHIITKDLPNWFWTDFEHVDQESQAINEGRPSVDPTTREVNGQKPSFGQNGVRDETKGSKWEYYRLRGTQIDFTDKFGAHTQLANTLIEPIESGPSSCITCHAKATASLGQRLGAQPPFVIRTIPPEFIDGLPDPDRFLGPDKKTIQFIQTDFLWSMPFRVHSENE
jgi:hypothetical protein